MKEFLNSLEKNKDIIAVILFGSYAKGKQSSLSDIDICLITSKENATLNILIPLKDEGFDVLEFHTLTEVMKYKVLTEGKILVLNDRSKFKEIKRKFLREYLAFTPKRNYYYKKLLEKI